MAKQQSTNKGKNPQANTNVRQAGASSTNPNKAQQGSKQNQNTAWTSKTGTSDDDSCGKC